MRTLVPIWLSLCFASERGALAAPQPSATGPRLEVAFVLDATSSMGPYIDGARARIKDIALNLAEGSPPPVVRFALVAYRDRGDEFVTRVDRFTTDIGVMRARLDRTTAQGGGDTPEAVLIGLYDAVTKLDWSASDPKVLKLIYLVGDAPDHHYPDAPTENDVIREARRRGIVIQTIACGDIAANPDVTFERVARLTEGRTLKLADGTAAAVRTREPGGHAAGLGQAVSGTARAYSASVGVDYARGGAAVRLSELAAAKVSQSGLLGAEVRWIRDPLAWSDLWAAYTSLSDPRPPLPTVDFSRFEVLCAGGADGGLEVLAVTDSDAGRAARMKPVSSPGATFYLVPREGKSSIGGVP
jgi:hypothetical protein